MSNPPVDPIEYYLESGDRIINLGIVKTPKGYEILQGEDGYYYWYEYKTGNISIITWNKWQVYYWIKHRIEEK